MVKSFPISVPEIVGDSAVVFAGSAEPPHRKALMRENISPGYILFAIIGEPLEN